MRRRRSFLLTVFALGVILVLFFTVGRIGGPSDESERETVAPPPDRTLPLAGTVAQEPAPPAVSGRVVDTAGEGLGGAHVTVVALDDGKRHEVNMRTDPDGRFADRSLRRGKVIYVEVVKKGYPVLRQRPKDLEVGPRRPVTLDLAIPETFFLAGHVKTVTQAVVEGAHVSYGDYPAKALTDELGRFRIEGIESVVLLRERLPRLRVRAEGYAVEEVELDLDDSHAIFDDIQVVLE